MSYRSDFFSFQKTDSSFFTEKFTLKIRFRVSFFQNEPFCTSKRPVLLTKMSHFIGRNEPF